MTIVFERKSLTERITHLFSKINWKASALDADAIRTMNTLGKDIADLEETKDKYDQLIKPKSYKLSRFPWEWLAFLFPWIK